MLNEDHISRQYLRIMRRTQYSHTKHYFSWAWANICGARRPAPTLPRGGPAGLSAPLPWRCKAFFFLGLAPGWGPMCPGDGVKAVAPGFGHGLPGAIAGRPSRLRAAENRVRALQERFVEGRLSMEQYESEVDRVVGLAR